VVEHDHTRRLLRCAVALSASFAGVGLDAERDAALSSAPARICSEASSGAAHPARPEPEQWARSCSRQKTL
jgi:hypothetical protein